MRLLKLFALLATVTGATAGAAQADGVSWGPETPTFNLEAILRPTADGPEKGFGHVKFRQPNDAELRIYLDVWVRDLLPNRTYGLQRAVDLSEPDGKCDSESGWVLVPPLGEFATDDRGTGRAALSRVVSLVRTFDIHFRVIDAITDEVVLQSACYQYTVSQ
jgi:hypothetical protein